MPRPALAERGYLEVARRRWPVLAGSVVVGLLLGSVTGSLSGDGYTSESVVALRPVVADPFAPNVRPSDSIDVATERRVAASRVVAGKAAAALGVAETDEIQDRSEEHTSDLQSLMRISYAVFCLKKKTTHISTIT